MKNTTTKLFPLAAFSLMAVMSPAQAADIPSQGSTAYVIDSDGDIVRDSWGRCVRSIDWSKDTALASCEGGEPKAAPAPVAAPAPKVLPEITPKAPVVEEKIVPNQPVHFQGFFDTDSSKLKSEAFGELDAYADYMTQMSDTSVKVTGHTDSTGSATYNQKLSEKRANAVKNYLEGKGIDSNRIQASGAGETQPIASNATKEGRAQNRRVEVEIIQ